MGNPDTVSVPGSVRQAGSSAEASRPATGSQLAAPEVPGANGASSSNRVSEEKSEEEFGSAVLSIYTFDPPIFCLHSSLFIRATLLAAACMEW